MHRQVISPTRTVSLDHITSVEKVGSNIVVRWSNGDKEIIQGDPGKVLWKAWNEEYK